MLRQLITEFRQKVMHDTLLGTTRYGQDLALLYQQILQELSRDYNSYRQYIAGFLTTLEEAGPVSSALSTKIFFDLEPAATGLKNLIKPDSSFANRPADNTAMKKLEAALSTLLAANNRVGLYNFEINTDSFSIPQAESIASVLIQGLQDACERHEWTAEDVSDWYLNLAIMRKMLLKSNNPEAFYYAAGMLLDRLASSEFYQTGRDLSEELLLTSFTDGVPEQGFFCSFRFYSVTKNAQAALVYANLTFYSTLKIGTVSTRFIRELVWQSMKMFRGLKLTDFAIQVYKNRPALVFESVYERHSLDHTYFTILLINGTPELPDIMLSYLDQERDSILEGGTHDAFPWLVTLYNIKRLYSQQTGQLQLLDQYVTLFERVVPEGTVRKMRNIVQGNLSDLKSYLLASLQKLHHTRSVDDFVYDNDAALTMSGRIIPSSVAEQDATAYLLAMVIRSDYSLLFTSEKAEPESHLLQAPLRDVAVYTHYSAEADLPDLFRIGQNEEISWLSLVEGSLYQMNLTNHQFSFHEAVIWNNQRYREAASSELFVSLKFDTTLKDRWGGVMQPSMEDYEDDERNLAAQLSFARLAISTTKDALLLVKDMELATYPHNLFLDHNGQFIHGNRAITNIVSSEWFLTNSGRQTLAPDYSKAIWIPVLSGDIALNGLYDRIGASLTAHAFSVTEELTVNNPLSSDLNIICSHGASNISETQIVSQQTLNENFEVSEHFTFDLDSVAGKGKILIFFVCHSGSMQSDFFRNTTASLAKRYLQKGYSAVIAPAWALHIYVPGIWLPVFLQYLSDGQNISAAVFKANIAVREVYPTPAAWACLHLYGDPHLSLTVPLSL